MGKILDYEQMNEILSGLDGIKKCSPIGYSNFGYPIDHFSYGHGDNHVIITAGTHASELISNVFVVRFMEKLAHGEIIIDKNVYTLHFIPFVNPEGTVIVTKAIRSLIPRDVSDDVEQTYCLAFYRNSFIEGKYAELYNDKDIKLQHWMFRYATTDLLDGELKQSVQRIIDKYDLPLGCMVNWSSNGRGVDLNSNIEASKVIDRVKNNEVIYSDLHLNTIKRNVLGPVGCPFYDNPGEIEPENKALIDFYESINENHNLIGSFIYHSCGNLVYYLGDLKEKNPWIDFGKENISNNLKVAERYAGACNYKLVSDDPYTTMDSKLRSLFPVGLLIELGGVRAHPLSQFMDFDLTGSGEDFKYVYSKIIKDNTEAILKTLPVMLEVSEI